MVQFKRAFDPIGGFPFINVTRKLLTSKCAEHRRDRVITKGGSVPIRSVFPRTQSIIAVATACLVAVSCPGASSAIAATEPTGTSATAPATRGAAPTSSFEYASAPGDVVGDGTSGKYTSPDSTVTVSGTTSYLTFDVSAAHATWEVILAAPHGEQLHPGTYLDAEGPGSPTGRAPGLGVGHTVDGVDYSCAEPWGSFRVDQIAADSSAAVTTLDVTFTLTCGGPEQPALTGTARYQAFPLDYRFTSDPGDYIGAGQTRSYTGATTLFRLSGNVSSRVDFGISGMRDTWYVTLEPADGQTLAIGEYPGAQSVGDHQPGHPGLNVSGDGRGCNYVAGNFTIDALTADAQGQVTSISATFDQYCGGGDPGSPGLHGVLHYLAGDFA